MQVGNAATVNQVLNYQTNYIEFVYGQNCGTYSVTFEPTDPACDITSLLSAAARAVGGGNNNLAYSQQMTLEYLGIDLSMVG